MHTEKLWLTSYTWDKVQEINQSLCQQQNMTFQTNSKSYLAVRELWQKAASQQLSLQEVLDLCRRCYEMAPFTFNNGNTFATIGKSIVDEWINTLPPVEAQIMRNTVGHYVAGIIGKKELQQVLQHFQTSWNTYVAAKQNAPATPAFSPLPAPQHAQAHAS